MKKQEAVRKEKTSKIDILSFISNKDSKKNNYFEIKDDIFSEIGLLDTDSLNILKKLTHFMNKDELFSILASKPLKNKIAKKAVRLMVIPNEKENNEMKLKKKK